MRRRRNPLPLIVVGLFVILVIIILSRCMFGPSAPTGSPEEVIQSFYEYEQEGDFGDSWKLFHSEMKKRFKKSDYIQTKNHVFLGHMGVNTFDVKIGELKELDQWTFKGDGPTLKDVWSAPITMTFNSQFGLMTINQTCYVALEEGNWKVLWDYNY